MSGDWLLIGLGNRDRGDDGVGLAVADALRDLALPGVRVIARSGDPLGLIDDWAGADRVIVVDALRSGAAPGSVHRIEAGDLPAAAGAPASSHGLGLAQAIELARTLGRLPRRFTVFGIEVGSVDPGAAFSPACRRGVDEAIRLVLAEVGAAEAQRA